MSSGGNKNFTDGSMINILLFWIVFLLKYFLPIKMEMFQNVLATIAHS